MYVNLPSPIQPIAASNQCHLWMKRDDLIHPQISGNKWRKLVGFFAPLGPNSLIVTFGGAYSNHLVATAAAIHALGHHGTFIIRGDELTPTASPHLRYCNDLGIKILFVSRAEFSALRDRQWSASSKQIQRWQIPANAYWLPEGGAGNFNDIGMQALWSELMDDAKRLLPHQHIDEIWLAAGTGATAQSLLRVMPKNCSTLVQVISAVCGNHREHQTAQALANEKNIQLKWQDETVFGGFAKTNRELERTTRAFTMQTSIPIDSVYNAKVWWHLHQHTSDRAIVWINTGGIVDDFQFVSK